MSKDSEKKLNHLLSMEPSGVVLTSLWLKSQGYYPQLLARYQKSGWLTCLGKGAYTRLKDKVSWPGAVYALQQQLMMPVHIGGVTALEIHGLAHNLVVNESKNKFHIYNSSKKKFRLPKWFVDHFQNHSYQQRCLFNKSVGIETKSVDGINIEVSSAERAILEVLDATPDSFSFEHVNHLVENMKLLRPDLLQRLLESCTSFKTKRLFLYLAEKHQLPSFGYLNLEKIQLGKGKRVVGEGGHYIAKYQLSVPKIDVQEDEEDIGYV